MQCWQAEGQRNHHGVLASTKPGVRRACQPRHRLADRSAAALPTVARQAAFLDQPKDDSSSQHLHKVVGTLHQSCERLERIQPELAAESSNGSDALQFISHLASFVDSCNAVIDIAAGLAQLNTSPECHQELTRLGVHARLLEQNAAMDAAVFKKLQSNLRRCQPALLQQHGGENLQTAALLERTWALEGYHPEDPSAYSVVLSREEKLDMLQGLRSEERALLADLMARCGQGPEVEVTSDELQNDSVLAAVVHWQQQQHPHQQQQTSMGSEQGAGSGPPPTSQQDEEVLLSLDALTCAHLLGSHPDTSLRQQVYEGGVEPWGLRVLHVLDQLATVRAKIARLYGAPSYAALTHRLTLLGGADQAIGFLLHLSRLLGPAYEAQAWRAQQSGQGHGQGGGECAPWNVDLKLWRAALQSGQQQAAGGNPQQGSEQLQQVAGQAGAHHIPPLPPVPALLQALSQELLEPGMGINLHPMGPGELQDTLTASTNSDEQHTLESLLASYLAEQQGLNWGTCCTGQHQQGEHEATAPVKAAASLHVYAVRVDSRGRVGTLVVNLRPQQSWSGARYLLPAACASSHSGTAGDALGPVVLVCLQPPSTAPVAPTGQSSVVLPSLLHLREALHELGHALHLLLAWRPSSPPVPVSASPGSEQQAGGQRVMGLHGFVPGSLSSSPLLLPLELLELPSTLMELLTCSPPALHRIMAAAGEASEQSTQFPGNGWSDPAVAGPAAQRLAAMSRAAWFSPLGLQLQVVADITDQLLLLDQATRDRVVPGAGNAADLWVRLCHESLPASVPPMFTPLQLLTLPRLAELRGHGYGYLAALALAAGAWHAHGLTTDDPLNPVAWRQLRHLVYEQGPGGLVGDAAALHAWLGEVTGHQVASVIPEVTEESNCKQGSAQVRLRAPDALLDLVQPRWPIDWYSTSH